MSRHPLYVVEQGCKVSRRGRRLVVTLGEEELTQAAILNVSRLVLFGNIQVTTQAIHLLLDEGVELVYLSERGHFHGRLVGASGGNAPLRIAQVLAGQNEAFALATARACVRGKLHNMRIFLQRYARRRQVEALSDAVAKIGELIRGLDRAGTIARLMGLEGRATAIYFSGWPHLLKSPWRFEKRVRRPPTDPTNVLLSLGYTLLMQNVSSAVSAVGLDPYIGFLHQVEYNRPSLALDLVEEFRPLIADSIALRCLNNDILLPVHFQAGAGPQPIRLSSEGVRLFIREFETRLGQKFTHPQTGERLDYRRLFFLQAQAMARTLPAQDPARVYEPFLAR